MCFVISIVLLLASFTLFNAGNITVAIGSLIVSLFFIFLMTRNILHVKKLKKKKKDDN
jgi:hypothetical protein